MFDYLVVGAGFAGATIAERLASDGGHSVLICDRRPHIAGNAYDHYDADGILVHKYGPHIFHTNARSVYEYLSRFTAWRQYQHRVLAWVDGQLLPIPINLDTVNRLYGLSLTSFELEKFFESVAERVEQVRTSEDVIVSKVGRELYEKFFRNYTRKQWGLDPSELDAMVTARVPVRTNRDDRYFTDTYQVMPLLGYTKMFERMLCHPNIKIMLNTDYAEIKQVIPHREVIFTGCVDEYFDYRLGRLPYRSLNFEFETRNVEVAQAGPVINYPNDERVHPSNGIQVCDRAKASQDVARLRIRVGNRRSLLPDSTARKRRSVQAVSAAGGPNATRALPRSVRNLQVLQHGPGRRTGVEPVFQAVRDTSGTGTDGRVTVASTSRRRSLEIWGGMVRALRRGEHFSAAIDCTISPTYVRDLVDAGTGPADRW